MLAEAMCLPCPGGTAENTEGATRCAECEPGFFTTEEGGAEQCTACPLGQAQPDAGQKFCLVCLPGTAATEVRKRRHAFVCVRVE